jgi:23S rRNA (adenine2503-C2)-methyltransferase
MSAERVNLLGLTRPELEAWCVERGGKPFRARQLWHWLYKRGVTDFEAMTDLAKGFRTQLQAEAEIRLPEVVTRQDAADGTIKWMLKADNTQGFEMVYIPEEDRSTLCISSQVGCAMDCSFCSTGQQGFNRNLSAAEIVGQVFLAQRELGFKAGDNRLISNVVLMGMGEPLANFRNVIPAMRVLLDEIGFDFSRRRLTLSTSGLVPQMYNLAKESNVALAVSLHAPDDELRNELVPINRRHPIKELLEACWHYIDEQNGRSVTFEYVMLDGVNDSPAQARALAKLLRGHPAKVNLIPFNPFPGTKYRRSRPEAITAFLDQVIKGGVMATVRRTRGDDIDAACGQLAGKVIDRTTVRMSAKRIAVPIVAMSMAIMAMSLGLGGCTTTSSNDRPVSDKNASHANVQLGIAYMQQGNLNLAKEKLERALKQDSRSFEAHWALATLSERLGQAPTAEQHYQAAQRLAPQNSEVANGYAVFLCNNQRVDQALKHFDVAMRDPLYRTPWAAATNAAVCLRSDKRGAEAVPYLERAIALRPDYVSAVVELADLQISLGKPDLAKVAVDRFYSIGRKSAEVLFVGVRAAVAMGNNSAADIYARLLRRDFPNSPQAGALTQILQKGR